MIANTSSAATAIIRVLEPPCGLRIWLPVTVHQLRMQVTQGGTLPYLRRKDLHTDHLVAELES